MKLKDILKGNIHHGPTEIAPLTGLNVHEKFSPSTNKPPAARRSIGAGYIGIIGAF